MKKENFELFLGCLGNGITVCNKSVEENGAYKTIAHIAECGKITWYVNPVSCVPGGDLLKIIQPPQRITAGSLPAAFLFILVDAKQMHCALTFWMYCAYNDL